MPKINEGQVIIDVPLQKVVDKKMKVFYNPVMTFNRDVSVWLLSALKKRNMQIALPLAGSGIRGIRLLKELNKDFIKKVYFNDMSKKAITSIKKNLKLNKINLKSKKLAITQQDANLFMLESKGFDYIDIDPFGTPNPFLETAITRLARTGILAVTATDTSALCGTYPKAGKRKYWATPRRNPEMFETGLRILIRKIQLIGTQHDKALTPIFCYSKDHYFRCFFRCEKSKTACDDILRQHGLFNDAGPLWLGPLWDKQITEKIKRMSRHPLAETLHEESKIGTIGYYDIPQIIKGSSIRSLPKLEVILNALKKQQFKSTRTHFVKQGIRSTITKPELIYLIENLSQES